MTETDVLVFGVLPLVILGVGLTCLALRRAWDSESLRRADQLAEHLLAELKDQRARRQESEERR